MSRLPDSRFVEKTALFILRTEQTVGTYTIGQYSEKQLVFAVIFK